jgi:hypothetical protein
MQFSIQWAGVSVAYIGMMAGTVGVWRASAEETSLSLRLFGALVGTLFGGGATIPFIASNFLSAYLALRLTRGQSFGTQFAAFMVIALALGWIVLKWLDQALNAMGGLHLDQSTILKLLGFAAATFALALFLMRFAPPNVSARSA